MNGMRMKPSDIRYISPDTGEVVSVETVEEFRIRMGPAKFKEFTFTGVTEERIVREIPINENQYYRTLFYEMVTFISAQDKGVQKILKSVFVDSLSMERAAKEHNISYENTRQMISRFRTAARNKFRYNEDGGV